MPLGTDETHNHDVLSLCCRIQRFCLEVHHSASSGAADLLSDFDRLRLRDYIAAIRAYHGWVVAQPQLDLPETHQAKIFKLPEQLHTGDLPMVDNFSVNDLCHLFDVSITELMNSQSSRMASGLIAFDSVRLKSIVDKAESLLNAYIAVATPLDMPESSPSFEMSGAGKMGI